MKRDIQVSTDVFAMIWRLRRDGEESEDAVLRRVLAGKDSDDEPDSGEHVESRAGVRFAAGFRIIRRYRGAFYEAKAERGGWRAEHDHRLYPSLNQLNAAIVDTAENAWLAWSYSDQNGNLHKLQELRNEIPERSGGSQTTWRGAVHQALKNLGGRAHLTEIYDEARKVRKAAGFSIPASLDAIVRKELEANSADSEYFQGRHDWFYLPEGKGSGVWAIRPPRQGSPT